MVTSLCHTRFSLVKRRAYSQSVTGRLIRRGEGRPHPGPAALAARGILAEVATGQFPRKVSRQLAPDGQIRRGELTGVL